MPQVAARIDENKEQWLKDYFRSKSAGAEFIIPWAVDVFFRAITNFKQIFSKAELKTIIDAFKEARLTPETTRLSYLTLRVNEACELNSVHLRYGASRKSLESKLALLDEAQATALMIWASAFWVSRNNPVSNIEDYITQK